MIVEWLKRKRNRISVELHTPFRKRYFCPVEYGMWKTVTECMRGNVKGRVLDVGCGEQGWKEEILKYAVEYESMDNNPNLVDKVNYFVDVQAEWVYMVNLCNTIFCLDLFEHLSEEPKKTFTRFYKSLIDNGCLIFSIPFLARIHNEPEDYFRFTEYAIRNLVKELFEIEKMVDRGGLFCFMYNQVSVFMMTFLYCKALNWILFPMNSVMIKTVWWLDKVFKTARYFPQGYTFVMRKKPARYFPHGYTSVMRKI